MSRAKGLGAEGLAPKRLAPKRLNAERLAPKRLNAERPNAERLGALLGALLAALLAAITLHCAVGCSPGPYACADDTSCVVSGVQGRCVPTGTAAYCAFADGKCPGSNLRWDESSAAEVKSQCVPPPLDGGAGD